MKRLLTFFYVALCLLSACKTASHSDLNATPAQKSKLKTCIVKTIKDSYPGLNASNEVLNQFADDLVARAPNTSGVAVDYPFESYVDELGCNANSKDDGYGVAIVAEWSVSPLNPDNSEIFSR
ncbi:MAG: hypothetical protein EOP04_07720 [Proteobacteria bacterium]|nr:MAG: hypothetical protein EOP04_07720 [Pseudomonadota bacterium]